MSKSESRREAGSDLPQAECDIQNPDFICLHINYLKYD